MTEDQFIFLQHVRETIRRHPDWLRETITAIQAGVAARIEEEQARAHTLDTAMTALLIDGADKRLSDQYRPVVDAAMRVSAYRT